SVARMVELSGDPVVTANKARFVAMPFPILLHLPAVILFSILGALQFSPGLRRKARRWHRLSGRALLPLGAISALTGLWMTLVYPWPEGDGVIVYVSRLIVGMAMLAQ